MMVSATFRMRKLQKANHTSCHTMN